MSSTPMFDPLTSEARSPWLAGLTEACYKLSTILDLETEELFDYPISPVDDRRLIYQAPLGNKLWMESPPPVVRKNGLVITPENDYFTINYLGGSVEFEKGFEPEELDALTVDVTHIVDVSNTIKYVLDRLDNVALNADKFKGYFPDVATMESTLGNGVGGDYVLIGGTESTFYVWNATTKKWEKSYKEPDLSGFYTKLETDGLLSQKEPVISPKGISPTDDDFYYGGRKVWVSLPDKVRDVTLKGLDTDDSSKIDATDTVLSSLGKLQAQIDDAARGLFGTGAPSTTTVGEIGQDYTNTSNGDKYHLVEISGNDYIWVKYQDELKFDDSPTPGSNNLLKSGAIYDELQKKADSSEVNDSITSLRQEMLQSSSQTAASLAGKADKVIPVTVGNIAVLGPDGNLVDSGKGVNDVGRSPIQATVTLSANQWFGINAPFTQTVSVSGILPDQSLQNITIAPYPDIDNLQVVTNGYIYCTDQGYDTLTFVALKAKPTTQAIFNVSIQNL